MPLGWNFAIDNDPSWVTEMRAIAVVGAAFMRPAAFLAALRIRPGPGHDCVELQREGAARLVMTL